MDVRLEKQKRSIEQRVSPGVGRAAARTVREDAERKAREAELAVKAIQRVVKRQANVLLTAPASVPAAGSTFAPLANSSYATLTPEPRSSASATSTSASTSASTREGLDLSWAGVAAVAVSVLGLLVFCVVFFAFYRHLYVGGVRRNRLASADDKRDPENFSGSQGESDGGGSRGGKWLMRPIFSFGHRSRPPAPVAPPEPPVVDHNGDFRRPLEKVRNLGIFGRSGQQSSTATQSREAPRQETKVKVDDAGVLVYNLRSTAEETTPRTERWQRGETLQRSLDSTRPPFNFEPVDRLYSRTPPIFTPPAAQRYQGLLARPTRAATRPAPSTASSAYSRPAPMSNPARDSFTSTAAGKSNRWSRWFVRDSFGAATSASGDDQWDADRLRPDSTCSSTKSDNTFGKQSPASPDLSQDAEAEERGTSGRSARGVWKPGLEKKGTVVDGEEFVFSHSAPVPSPRAAAVRQWAPGPPVDNAHQPMTSSPLARSSWSSTRRAALPQADKTMAAPLPSGPQDPQF